MATANVEAMFSLGTGSAKVEAREPEGMQLFVGHIPPEITREDLLPMFEAYGEVYDFQLLYDKETGQHKGCGFLKYYSNEASECARGDLHAKMTLPGSNKPLHLKLSQHESDIKYRKVFVGMLNRSVFEDDLRNMFSPFGTIEDINLLREAGTGISKGCGFVTFLSPDDTKSAIKALHHSQTLEGCPKPMIVRYADTKEDKAARDAMHAEKRKRARSPSPPRTLLSALPKKPERPITVAMIQQQVGYYQQLFSNLTLEQLLQGKDGPLGEIDINLTLESVVQQAIQEAIRAGEHGMPVDPFILHSRQLSGPPGANIVIHQLPLEINENCLKDLFSPFGEVVSVKIFRERETLKSKGFGFVSYDDPTSANKAVKKMNNFAIGELRINVHLKKNDHAPPE